jgi:hypothetical protein
MWSKNELEIDIKQEFYHFKNCVYIKIKHRCGIAEGERAPLWFLFTIRLLFMPIWTMRYFKEIVK